MTDLSYRVARYQIDDLRRHGEDARLAAAARSPRRRPPEVRTTRLDQIGGLGT